jgi:hypothetical protein
VTTTQQEPSTTYSGPLWEIRWLVCDHNSSSTQRPITMPSSKPVERKRSGLNVQEKAEGGGRASKRIREKAQGVTTTIDAGEGAYEKRKQPPAWAKRGKNGKKTETKGADDEVGSALKSMRGGERSPVEPRKMEDAFEEGAGRATKVSPSGSGEDDGLALQNEQLRADNARKDKVIRELQVQASEAAQRRKAIGKIRWERRSMAHLARHNRNALHRYVKDKVMPKVKFFPKGWHVYCERPATLSAKLLLPWTDEKTGTLMAPRLTCPEDKTLEQFWYEDVVPALAYKICQLKNTFLQKMKCSYRRECSMLRASFSAGSS